MSHIPPPRSLGFATTLTKEFTHGNVTVEVSWFDGHITHHAGTTVPGQTLRGQISEEAYLAHVVGKAYLELAQHLATRQRK
jgi:hypothetical protein